MYFPSIRTIIWILGWDNPKLRIRFVLGWGGGYQITQKAFIAASVKLHSFHSHIIVSHSLLLHFGSLHLGFEDFLEKESAGQYACGMTKQWKEHFKQKSRDQQEGKHMELLPLPHRALQEGLWKERQKSEREAANGFTQSNNTLRYSLQLCFSIVYWSTVWRNMHCTLGLPLCFFSFYFTTFERKYCTFTVEATNFSN